MVSSIRRPSSLVLASLALGLCLGGCSVLRPVREPILARLSPAHASAGGAVDFVSAAARRETSECLLVLLPGIGDGARAFEQHGFVRDAERAGVACDLALVDAHFAYYLSQAGVVERLSTDVLEEARRRGYRSVWLVGVSIGGYGAMLTARARPDLVDGVILLAPMVGVPPREDEVAREVAAAGGLRRWGGVEGPIPPPRHHFREPLLVWDWLRDTAIDPRRSGRLLLAFGTDDRWAARHALVARALPPEAVFRVEGAHDWPTWRRLWRQVLGAAPWSAVDDRRVEAERAPTSVVASR